MPEAKGKKRKLSPKMDSQSQQEGVLAAASGHSEDEPELGLPTTAEESHQLAEPVNGDQQSESGEIHNANQVQKGNHPGEVNQLLTSSDPAYLQPAKSGLANQLHDKIGDFSGADDTINDVTLGEHDVMEHPNDTTHWTASLETTVQTLMANQDTIIHEQKAMSDRLGRMEASMLDSLNRLTKVLENVTAPIQATTSSVVGQPAGEKQLLPTSPGTMQIEETSPNKSDDQTFALTHQMPSLTSATRISRARDQSGGQVDRSLPVMLNSGSSTSRTQTSRHQSSAISAAITSSQTHPAESFSPQFPTSGLESPSSNIQHHQQQPDNQQPFPNYIGRQTNRRHNDQQLFQSSSNQQIANSDGNGGIPEIVQRIHTSTHQRTRSGAGGINQLAANLALASSPLHSDSPQLITDNDQHDYSTSPTDQDEATSSSIILEMLRGRGDRGIGQANNSHHLHQHPRRQQQHAMGEVVIPTTASDTADLLLEYHRHQPPSPIPAASPSNPARPGEPVIGNVRNVLPAEFLRPAAARGSSAISQSNRASMIKAEPVAFGFGGEEDSMMDNEQESEMDVTLEANYFSSAESWLNQAFLQTGASRLSPSIIGAQNGSSNVSFNRQRNSVQQKIVDLLYNSGMDFTTYSNTRKWINNKLRELCGGNETIIAYSYLGEGGPSRSRTKYADCGEIICHPLTCLGDLNDAGLADPTHSDGYITIAQNPILLKDILVKTISNARQKLFAKYGPLKRTRDEEEQHLRSRGASVNLSGGIVTINTTNNNGPEEVDADSPLVDNIKYDQ